MAELGTIRRFKEQESFAAFAGAGIISSELFATKANHDLWGERLMKTRRLVLCLFLSLVLVVTFIPMISFAEETPDDTKAATTDVQAMATDEEKADSDTKEQKGEVKSQGTEQLRSYDCYHEWDYTYQEDGAVGHIVIPYCTLCGEQGEAYSESHNYGEEVYDYRSDEDFHWPEYQCEDCGYVIEVYGYEPHEFDFYTADCTKLNKTYHLWDGWCDVCGEPMTVKGKHTWKAVSCARKATKLKKGSTKYKCKYCNAVKYVPFNWKYGSKYSIQYDITNHTNVYKNSKSITVWLKNPLKGAVIKVKVGGKTFKKKIKNNSKKQKVKIKLKKSWYGKKITIKLYYKGKLVGKDRSYNAYDNPPYNTVLYGKNIKKGMTKKMVRNLYYWGPPDEIESYSSGLTYWYYDHEYAVFKNGKVKSWWTFDM